MAMKLVDADVLDANLTSVADKIRAKTGGADALAFPSGFVSALDTIESADSALAEVEYAMSKGYTDYQRYFSELNQMEEVPMGILQHISNGGSFSNTFYSCTGLTEVPVLDTSNGRIFGTMFSVCRSLKTIGGIDITNATNVNMMFYLCNNLEDITFNGVIKITGLDLSASTLLTHDSLMSAINALYDHASAGTSGTFKLTLGTTNLAKLTDAEKAIATQKGWTLA